MEDRDMVGGAESSFSIVYRHSPRKHDPAALTLLLMVQTDALAAASEAAAGVEDLQAGVRRAERLLNAAAVPPAEPAAAFRLVEAMRRCEGRLRSQLRAVS